MGLLDGLFGGRSDGRGGMSPLTLGLLALLAYKAYQGSKGGATAGSGAARDPWASAASGFAQPSHGSVRSGRQDSMNFERRIIPGNRP